MIPSLGIVYPDSLGEPRMRGDDPNGHAVDDSATL